MAVGHIRYKLKLASVMLFLPVESERQGAVYLNACSAYSRATREWPWPSVV